MQTTTRGKIEPTPRASESSYSISRALRCAARWFSETLVSQGSSRSRRVHLAACASIFLLASGVRLLHWQDSYAQIERKGSWDSAIARHYQNEARRMLDDRGILFPRAPVDPGDARLVLHPPGYSALIAALFGLWSDSSSAVRLAQIIFDALSAVMVFLIAAALFKSAIAVIAAALVAVSPHLAYYSLWLSPDTLCVLPILVAVYLIIKASERPRLITIFAAGAMVGVSCWLRANALLLAPFLAVALMIVTGRARRLSYGAAFVGATVLVISPITIRNWILFHHFIPISIAGGENLVVGIADFDKEGRFGMPTSDGDAAVKDAEWRNRPDYAISAWLPDGVERDQARYLRGLQVIRSNPGWFLGVMFQRAFFMLTYNGSGRADWPHNTSRVPIVSAEPSVMHSGDVSSGMQPVWSRSMSELLTDDSILSPQADVSVEEGTGMLRITGDRSEFGDQLASGRLAVKRRTDYLMTLQMALDRGPAAAKVTSSDRRKALGSEILDSEAAERIAKRQLKKRGDSVATVDPVSGNRIGITQIEFASGDLTEARLVISNNGATPVPPVTRVGQIQLFELGDTPFQWTRSPRAPIRVLQKNIFKTNVLLPLIAAGVLLLVLAGRGRALILLLAVPIYYLCAQSVLSTEYRYILAIHYFLFIIAAVTLYSASMLISHAAGRVRWRRDSSKQYSYR